MGTAVGTVRTEGVLEAKPGFVGVAWAVWKAGLRSDLRSAFSIPPPCLSVLRPRV